MIELMPATLSLQRLIVRLSALALVEVSAERDVIFSESAVVVNYLTYF